MKPKLNKKGMTLTEVIAGIAILLLATFILASGFGLAIRIMYEGDLMKNAGQLAAGVVDGAKNTDNAVQDSGIVGGDVKMTLQNGKQITAKGSYRTYSKGANPYARFQVLDDTEDIAYSIWMQVGDAYAFYQTLSKEEKEEWGFGTNQWMLNEGIRKYMITYIWNGTWPEFPREILERNEVSKTDKNNYYIQPRYFREGVAALGAYDGQFCALTFATTKPTDVTYWNANLIYDQTTRTWYYSKKSLTVTTPGNAEPNGAKYILDKIKSDPSWVALK